MPRTIRKRQLRNKKSRKQRGGANTEQIAQIKEIHKKIDDSIKELVAFLENNVLDESVNLQIKTKPIAESAQTNSNSVVAIADNNNNSI